jgi:hypothetical protein
MTGLGLMQHVSLLWGLSGASVGMYLRTLWGSRQVTETGNGFCGISSRIQRCHFLGSGFKTYADF